MVENFEVRKVWRKEDDYRQYSKKKRGSLRRIDVKWFTEIKEPTGSVEDWVEREGKMEWRLNKRKRVRRRKQKKKEKKFYIYAFNTWEEQNRKKAWWIFSPHCYIHFAFFPIINHL